jgi:hypothetical protein
MLLSRVLEALKPGGSLLIETRHWDSMRRNFESTTVRQSGADLLVEQHTYHPEIGVQWTDQTLLIAGRRLTRSYGIRRYTFPEMRRLCLSAGFAHVAGFDESGGILKVDSRRCVLVARK